MGRLRQAFRAVTSAIIGIGKREDLVKDFEQTERQGPWLYIVVALVMTAGFVVLVMLAVKFALSTNIM
ncbi:MAG: DUF2970 domain-containing protein [Proteobacteria bacterium]|nr:DUF2970 domain-containing protein [Pseudomonadota bacterium]MCH9750127.1 DUF2970 domain-containing protein [Pseudomonadota bacterium]